MDMHLTDILSQEMVWPTLSARTKPEVVKEFAERMAAADPTLSAEVVAEVLMERERLGSTGIQDGIAIPHGKVPGLERIVIACGLCPAGIEFDAHDGKPTKIFFVLLAPEFAAGLHLKALARLSRLLKDKKFRDRLMSSKDAGEIYRAIAEGDEKN